MLKKKRWLLAGIIALAAIALLVLVLLLVKNGRSKQINVYAVSDFSMDQYWGSESETYGAVYLDKIQTVYISDTQKVSEVYVKEGQTVKAGDKLLAYDTTLTDIALQKAQITLEKSKAQLESAKRELQKLNTLTPHSSVLVTPNNPQPVLTPQTTPKRISGSGTEDDPYYYLWGASDRFDDAFFSSLFGGADRSVGVCSRRQSRIICSRRSSRTMSRIMSIPARIIRRQSWRRCARTRRRKFQI